MSELAGITMEALEKAKEAFNKRLEYEGYDPAYWDIRFTAWEVGDNFTTRLRRYEIEDEVKDDSINTKKSKTTP